MDTSGHSINIWGEEEDKEALNLLSGRETCRPGRHAFANGKCIFCPVEEGEEQGMDDIQKEDEHECG